MKTIPPDAGAEDLAVALQLLRQAEAEQMSWNGRLALENKLALETPVQNVTGTVVGMHCSAGRSFVCSNLLSKHLHDQLSPAKR